jgi:hypothetical protein
MQLAEEGLALLKQRREHQVAGNVCRRFKPEPIIRSVGSGLKEMRTGHKQGEMQLIAFTCRLR